MQRPREALWVVATCVLGEDSSRERGPAPKAEDLLRQAAWRPPSPAPLEGAYTVHRRTDRSKEHGVCSVQRLRVQHVCGIPAEMVRPRGTLSPKDSEQMGNVSVVQSTSNLLFLLLAPSTFGCPRPLLLSPPHALPSPPVSRRSHGLRDTGARHLGSG